MTDTPDPKRPGSTPDPAATSPAAGTHPDADAAPGPVPTPTRVPLDAGATQELPVQGPAAGSGGAAGVASPVPGASAPEPPAAAPPATPAATAPAVAASALHPAAPLPSAGAAGVAPADPAERRWRHKGWLIAAAAVGAVALVGGGVALGAALTDRDDRGIVVSWDGDRNPPVTVPEMPGPRTDLGQADDRPSLTHDQLEAQKDALRQQRESMAKCLSGDNTDDADCRAMHDFLGGRDIELSGEVLEKASRAALEAAGGEGTIIEAETSHMPLYAYKVEVLKADGTQVEVYLDENYQVLATDIDS